MRQHTITDLLKIVEGEISVAEYAKARGIKVCSVYQAIKRRGLKLKVKYRLTSPYTIKEYDDLESIAQDLHCSVKSVKNAIAGKWVKFIDELQIKIEVIKNE